jgi:hypothetical protein
MKYPRQVLIIRKGDQERFWNLEDQYHLGSLIRTARGYGYKGDDDSLYNFLAWLGQELDARIMVEVNAEDEE